VITKHSVSKYDLEEMFTVNHCGTFCLTMNLLDLLEESKGRLVTVASDAHRFSGKRE
jgi:NAD(P)-dependent dehydrogenase (short-subunit alcohol dehydrogenase family)